MNLTITLTKIGASGTLTLPMPEGVTEDQTGNVTFSFAELMSDLRAALVGFAVTNVEQYRNRANTLVCICDPTAVLLSVAWQELDPFNATARARTVQGCAVIAQHQHSRRDNALSLTVYACGALYERTTGTVLE